MPMDELSQNETGPEQTAKPQGDEAGNQAALSNAENVANNASNGENSGENANSDDGKSVLTRSSEEQGEQTGGEGESPAEGVPETYEVSVPDGAELDQAALDHFSPAFKELQLTNDQVQKLADLRLEEQQKQAQHWADTRRSWVKQGEKDAEVGGDRYRASVATAQSAIGQFADQEAVQFLEDSGLGDHPAMLRMFHRIGAAMADDSIVTARGGAADQGPAARLNRLYPTMNPSTYKG